MLTRRSLADPATLRPVYTYPERVIYEFYSRRFYARGERKGKKNKVVDRFSINLRRGHFIVLNIIKHAYVNTSNVSVHIYIKL